MARPATPSPTVSPKPLTPGQQAQLGPSHPPVTPDGRYIVVRGRLWRRANPDLPAERREALVARLMDARRAVKAAKRLEREGRAGSAEALAVARAAVDDAKTGLGERGPVWWTDGAPDLNRRLVRTTPYAEWHAGLGGELPGGQGVSGAGPGPR